MLVRGGSCFGICGGEVEAVIRTGGQSKKGGAESSLNGCLGSSCLRSWSIDFANMERPLEFVHAQRSDLKYVVCLSNIGYQRPFLSPAWSKLVV